MAKSVNPALWSGRPVMVTGHTGFKGSWLTAWLERMGARVVGYALEPPTQPSLFDVYGLNSVCESHIADIRDLSTLAGVVETARPEIIFHLAAQPLVLESYADPVTTYATNVMGTAHVLECARLHDCVRAVIIVTSDKCYRDQGLERGYREDDILGGADPYSSSKACSELVTDSYRQSFFSIPDAACIASVRAGNVIGGGDWGANRLVPDLVRALTSGQPIVLRHKHAIRPWQFVLEPLAGYLTLAQNLSLGNRAASTAWNFGPAKVDERSVGDLIGVFENNWGETVMVEQLDAPAGKETASLKVDSAKAQSGLGWSPCLSFEEAAAWTVEWYRTYYENPAEARALGYSQIDAYSRRT